MFGPAFKLLNCNSSEDFCANNPAVVASSATKLTAVVLSGDLAYSSEKLLFTFINASLRSSPVPSFASVPMFIILLAILSPTCIY